MTSPALEKDAMWAHLRDVAAGTASGPVPRPANTDEGAPGSSKRPAKRGRRAKAAPSTSSAGRTFERGDHVELGEELVRDLAAPGDLVFDEFSPWRYEATRGVWAVVDRAVESQIVQGYAGAAFGEKGKPLEVSAADVAGSIKLAHDQVTQTEFFSGAPSGLAFANGFVRVTDTGEVVLSPHAREHRARAAYPFAFERGALPRGFLGFLGSLFRDDEDRVEKELAVQEFFGACAVGIATRYQRCVVAVGGGENGKSRLADVMIACMPDGTTSAIAPQEWGQEYRRADLACRHLNAIGELPERDILASEAFKAIVAGDPIVGRRIREAPMTFRPIAGHFFAANALPGTPDQTEGFWRRFLVLTFNRSFKGDPERDPHVAERILATEKPAVVSWLIEGAARVVRDREYTIPATHHEALAAWRRSADQVALFVEAETRPLRPDEGLSWGISGAELYASYRRWCEGNGHRAMASNRFADRMKSLGLGATHTKSGRRYPVAFPTAADRADEVKGGEGLVKGHPSPFFGGPTHA